MLVVPVPSQNDSPQQTRKQPATWYERAVRQINPNETDYGSIWEKHKQDFIAQFRNPYFRYGLGTTLAILALFVTLFAQYLSYRRALEIAVQSVADIRRHDEYARRAAREAIQRYNDHIESCNRVIEANESGLWRWVSTAELAAMKHEMQQANDELKTAREEIKRLDAELDAKSATIADMSVRQRNDTSDTAQPSRHPVPPPHVQRINQLELELNFEKKKNQRLKGTALDARNS